MRDAFQLLAVALAILIMGAIGYQLTFSGEHEASLTIERIQGEVQVESAGARSLAAPEVSLGTTDRLITSEGALAVLNLGGESRVTLGERSSIEVLGVSEDGVDIELKDGEVTATIRPGGAALGIAAGGTSVRATDADFSARVSGDGAAIEATRGELEVLGGPEVDRLSAGERLLTLGDQPPLRVPIPEDLLLEVHWPERLRVRDEEINLVGETEPGARVRVATSGGPVESVADERGQFELLVQLEQGENALSLEATGLTGQQVTISQAVIRDGHAPVADIEIRY